MALVPVGPGRFALIDDEDAERVTAVTWWLSGRYARTDLRRKPRRTIAMHRLILGISGTAHVDHINGNCLDNRKANLRVATRSQNRQNLRGAQRNSRTGMRNVYKQTHGARFAARIVVNGTRIWLGSFITASDADAAAKAGRARYMTHSPEANRPAAGEK